MNEWVLEDFNEIKRGDAEAPLLKLIWAHTWSTQTISEGNQNVAHVRTFKQCRSSLQLQRAGLCGREQELARDCKGMRLEIVIESSHVSKHPVLERDGGRGQPSGSSSLEHASSCGGQQLAFKDEVIQ